MIESASTVSTGWVFAADLNPLNECSDCTQVKTTESAQRLARHEEPQKHGILMRLFIAIGEFFGFRFGAATGGTQAAASPSDALLTLNEQMAKGLPDVMRSQANGILAKREPMSTEQFMASYAEQLTGSNIMRNANCLLSNVVKLGELVPALKVDTTINEVDIVGGFSLKTAQYPEHIALMQNDTAAATKLLDAVIFLATKFAEFPDPGQVGPDAVVAYVKDIDAEFVALFALKSDAVMAHDVSDASFEVPSVITDTLGGTGAEEAVLPEANFDTTAIDQPDPVTLLKAVKVEFTKIDDEVALPTRNDFYATMNSLQRPESPLAQAFQQLEQLADHGSTVEKSIASMVLDHTAVGQTRSYGDLFGERKEEANLLQAHSALSFVDTLQKKLDLAGRLLGMQAAHAA